MSIRKWEINEQQGDILLYQGDDLRTDTQRLPSPEKTIFRVFSRPVWPAKNAQVSRANSRTKFWLGCEGGSLLDTKTPRQVIGKWGQEDRSYFPNFPFSSSHPSLLLLPILLTRRRGCKPCSSWRSTLSWRRPPWGMHVERKMQQRRNPWRSCSSRYSYSCLWVFLSCIFIRCTDFGVCGRYCITSSTERCNINRWDWYVMFCYHVIGMIVNPPPEKETTDPASLPLKYKTIIRQLKDSNAKQCKQVPFQPP